MDPFQITMIVLVIALVAVLAWMLIKHKGPQQVQEAESAALMKLLVTTYHELGKAVAAEEADAAASQARAAMSAAQFDQLGVTLGIVKPPAP